MQTLMIPNCKPNVYVVVTINTQGQYSIVKTFDNEDMARANVKWLRMQPSVVYSYFTKTELN